MERRLNIGFLIPGNKKQLPAWYLETIEKLCASGKHSIRFFIIKNTPPPATISFSLRLFKKFEDWWFASDYDAATLKSVKHLLDETNTTILNTDFFIKEDFVFRELMQMQLDVIYTVDFNGQKENLSHVASYGLWYVKFGYGKYSDFQIPAFSEVMHDEAAIGSYLLARKNDMDLIIYEGTTSIVPYSVKNSFNSVAWKSSSFLFYRLNTLSQLHDTFPFHFNNFLATNKSPKYILPGNFKMFFLFVRNIFRYLVYKIRKLKKDHFTLLISNTSFALEKINRFYHLSPAKNSFYADPFVIEKDNINYIFFEEFRLDKNKAHISLIEVGTDKEVSPPRIVLDKTYHLSYPFVFNHDGEYYMIPETASNKTVELYKASNFPGKWEFVMNIMENQYLIDVTLHFENGFWWMFANSFNHPFQSTNDQLFLFYSKELLSVNWKPHPLNPVATHIDNCRPAGRLFKQNGKLYRPSQNNASKQYGHGLKINEVIVMNEKDYKEQEVYSFDKVNAGVKACHNIDFTETLTVIDGIIK
jgi:hypothetical protein